MEHGANLGDVSLVLCSFGGEGDRGCMLRVHTSRVLALLPLHLSYRVADAGRWLA